VNSKTSLTKYSDLPTSFYEAELDYFGKHMYDEKGDRAPGPTEGNKHFKTTKHKDLNVNNTFFRSSPFRMEARMITSVLKQDQVLYRL